MIDQSKLAAIPLEALRQLNRAVVDEIKLRMSRTRTVAARSIEVDDRAQFHSTKLGRTVSCTVTKVNRTRVVVKEHGYGDRSWIVAANVLQIL